MKRNKRWTSTATLATSMKQAGALRMSAVALLLAVAMRVRCCTVMPSKRILNVLSSKIRPSLRSFRSSAKLNFELCETLARCRKELRRAA